MEKTDEIRFKLTSLYDQSPVTLWFHDRDQVKIITENMDLAGNIIQSLANFLNIEHLMVKIKKNNIRFKCSNVHVRSPFFNRRRQIIHSLRIN